MKNFAMKAICLLFAITAVMVMTDYVKTCLAANEQSKNDNQRSIQSVKDFQKVQPGDVIADIQGSIFTVHANNGDSLRVSYCDGCVDRRMAAPASETGKLRIVKIDDMPEYVSDMAHWAEQRENGEQYQ